jgi:hypothetical protein
MALLLHSESIQYGVSVPTKLTTDLPEVMGDRVQLQQVLMNLMMNSIDAMKDMDGRREITIQSQRGEDGQVLIWVSDTGVGLPPERRTRSLMRSLPPRLTARAWACGSAAPSLNRTGGPLVGCRQPSARRKILFHITYQQRDMRPGCVWS